MNRYNLLGINPPSKRQSETIYQTNRYIESSVYPHSNNMALVNNIINNTNFTNTVRAIMPPGKDTPSRSNLVKTETYNPTFLEIDAFLKHDLKYVLVTLLARMTMIVSSSEMDAYNKVCDYVAIIISDSFYISLDPERSIKTILERITSEQNSISIDARGLEPSFSMDQKASKEDVVPNALDVIIKRLTTDIGSERYVQKTPLS